MGFIVASVLSIVVTFNAPMNIEDEDEEENEEEEEINDGKIIKIPNCEISKNLEFKNVISPCPTSFYSIFSLFFFIDKCDL